MEPLSVADKQAIGELYAVQSHAIDSGDASGWAATFTPDGSFESPTYRLTATGTKELTAFASTSNSAAVTRGDQLRHWLSSLVFTVEAGGTAVAGYMMILATSASGSRVDRSLTFEDHLTRHGAGWLVASRQVFRDDS